MDKNWTKMRKMWTKITCRNRQNIEKCNEYVRQNNWPKIIDFRYPKCGCTPIANL